MIGLKNCLLVMFAVVAAGALMGGCGGNAASNEGNGNNGGGGNMNTTTGFANGSYSLRSIAGANGQAASCATNPTVAVNNTTLACGPNDTFVVTANNAYTFTSIDSADFGNNGQGTFTVNGSAITFNGTGNATPIVATIVSQSGATIVIRTVSGSTFNGATYTFVKTV